MLESFFPKMLLMVWKIFKMKNYILQNKRLFFLLMILIVLVGVKVFFPTSDKFSIQLKTIDYNPYDTKSVQTQEVLLKKPYMLIEFFTLNCHHCVKNIPLLNELHLHKNINVVGYVLLTENKNKIQTYADEHNILYPLSRISNNYMEIFDPVFVPVSFLIDTKSLKVVEKIVGNVDPKMLERYLQ